MKKQYVKPMLIAEHFTLTQSIAACTTKIGFLDSQCVIKDPDSSHHMLDFAFDNFFVGGHCMDAYADDMSEEDQYCYHTNINTVFTS